MADEIDTDAREFVVFCLLSKEVPMKSSPAIRMITSLVMVPVSAGLVGCMSLPDAKQPLRAAGFIEASPTSSQRMLEIAGIYEKAGQSENARAVYSQILAQRGNSADQLVAQQRLEELDSKPSAPGRPTPLPERKVAEQMLARQAKVPQADFVKSASPAPVSAQQTYLEDIKLAQKIEVAEVEQVAVVAESSEGGAGFLPKTEPETEPKAERSAVEHKAEVAQVVAAAFPVAEKMDSPEPLSAQKETIAVVSADVQELFSTGKTAEVKVADVKQDEVEVAFVASTEVEGDWQARAKQVEWVPVKSAVVEVPPVHKEVAESKPGNPESLNSDAIWKAASAAWKMETESQEQEPVSDQAWTPIPVDSSASEDVYVIVQKGELESGEVSLVEYSSADWKVSSEAPGIASVSLSAADGVTEPEGVAVEQAMKLSASEVGMLPAEQQSLARPKLNNMEGQANDDRLALMIYKIGNQRALSEKVCNALQDCLHHENSMIALLSAEALFKHRRGNELALQIIKHSLADSGEEIRMIAVHVLASVYDSAPDEACQLMCEKFQDESSCVRRLAVLLAGGFYRHSVALTPTLQNLVKTGQDLEIREAANLSLACLLEESKSTSLSYSW